MKCKKKTLVLVRTLWYDIGNSHPEGVTDPDYCVLKFTAERLRFYSKFKSETIELV